ncbi:MAG: alpha/beta fold hydrolase [Spirulina sp. DLM2.Bin59]|nr:MAG: alpha/beta fold hydrolase [Spirulina sp. DLM2.Bin59]
MTEDCGVGQSEQERGPWEQRIGRQRDWVWRGWPVRYSFAPARAGGRGLPVILIHGFGAAIEHWRHNIPVLRQDRPVYALDLLGFGGSRKAKTRYSLDLWVEQLHDFWASWIGRPVVLVGNSLGSLVCALAAARYPEMVAGVALINLPDVALSQQAIAPPLRPVMNTLERIFTPSWLLKLLLVWVRRPAVIRHWVTLAYPHREAVDDELVQILSNPAYDRGAGDTLVALFHGLRGADFAPPMTAVMAGLTQPILLLWGESDRFVPFALAQHFRHLNPRLQFVPLPGAGHCPQDECPELFHQALLPWLAQLEQGAPPTQQ